MSRQESLCLNLTSRLTGNGVESAAHGRGSTLDRRISSMSGRSGVTRDVLVTNDLYQTKYMLIYRYRISSNVASLMRTGLWRVILFVHQ